MQAIRQKFIRVARWVGLVLIAATAGVRRQRGARLHRRSTVSPEPPTGWLSGGEYPITATCDRRARDQEIKWASQGE